MISLSSRGQTINRDAVGSRYSGLDSMFDPFNASVQYGSNSIAHIVYDITVSDKPNLNWNLLNRYTSRLFCINLVQSMILVMLNFYVRWNLSTKNNKCNETYKWNLRMIKNLVLVMANLHRIETIVSKRHCIAPLLSNVTLIKAASGPQTICKRILNWWNIIFI